MLLSRWALLLSLCAGLAVGCDEDALKVAPDGGTTPGGLTPAQAAAVVARVGDKTITLGDFVATIERMNEYDRLRYQTKEQRRKLLQEMVDNELLAQEAERLGLTEKDHVEQAVRQVLRDAMLAKAREGLPKLGDIPMAEVRAYYAEHKDRFVEPERRRVSAIVMADATAAKKVLDEALEVKSGEAWGALFHEHSLSAPKKRNPAAPADLAGDLGIVGPVGDKRGANRKVPPAVQQAVFTLQNVGEVYGQLVEVGDTSLIVRMSGRTSGHTRSLAEAERSIRVRLAQELLRKREAELVAGLRKRFQVVTDDEALAQVRLPEGVEGLEPPRPPGSAAATAAPQAPAPEGAPAKGGPAKGAPAKGGPAKGAPATGGPAKGAPAKGGPADDGDGYP